MLKILKRKDKRTALEKEIESLLKCMKNVEPDTEEYGRMSDNLETLYSAKGKDKPWRISPDTIFVGVVGLLQVGMILGHERLHVVTSKAMNYVFKGRV